MLNEDYPQLKVKFHREGADNTLDFVNATYGYESGDSEEKVNTPVRPNRMISPPSSNAKGSPYRASYQNLMHKKGPSKEQLLTEASNAQAHSAFGGGSNSINELLESEPDR